jgi:ELWxxDGT repeat protein
MRKKLLLLFCLGSFPMMAQTLDLTRIETNWLYDSMPYGFTEMGDLLFFTKTEDNIGRELWVHNTVTGTYNLVKDIAPGSSGVETQEFVVMNNVLYFSAGIAGVEELWRSDGTEAGTYQVKDINPGGSNSSYPVYFTVFNNKLYFSAQTPAGREVWASDGTDAGTVMLKDIAPGIQSSYPQDFIVMENSLYFLANDKIWKTDGTEAGTIAVTGTGVDISGPFKRIGNQIYFRAYSAATGLELWKTDGTTTGTQIVKDIFPGVDGSLDAVYVSAVFGNELFFSAAASASQGYELWKTDGTAAGTVLVKDIHPSGNGLFGDSQMVTANGKLFFTANSAAYGRELWVSDGTSEGTTLAKDIIAGPTATNIYLLTAAGDHVVFSTTTPGRSYPTPWSSNGTDSGTVELANTSLVHTSATELEFKYCFGKVFFGAGNGSDNGIELWETAGTPETTLMRKDLGHTAGGILSFNRSHSAVELNGKVIYVGSEGLTGAKLFVTDGTAAGTYKLNDTLGYSLFLDINDGYVPLPNFYKAGNYVFFTARNTSTGYELYRTDGTPAGTIMVKDIAPGAASSLTAVTVPSLNPLCMVYNDIFYFVANDQVHGDELWRSDGSTAGTYMLKDIGPGNGYPFQYQLARPGQRKHFALLNGLMYFAADDGTGNDLWRTDGTEAGTIKVVDLTQAGSAYLIDAANGKLFYSTITTGSTYGPDLLWATDGNSPGQLVGTYPITGLSQIDRYTVNGNWFYYTVFLNDGYNVMRSDGTPGGAMVVKNNLSNQVFQELGSCGNKIYFGQGGVDTISQQIWMSDGTPGGTVLVNDATTLGQNIQSCKCIDDHLMFLKEAGLATAPDLWISDGTIENTVIIPVTVAGGETFAPYYGLTNIGLKIGDKLLFAGRTGDSGTELYSGPVTAFLGTTDYLHPQAENGNVRVYPNPTNGVATISSTNGEAISEIVLYNIAGVQVTNNAIDIASATVSVDMSRLQKGIYFVTVKGDRFTETKKIILN